MSMADDSSKGRNGRKKGERINVRRSSFTEFNSRSSGRCLDIPVEFRYISLCQRRPFNDRFICVRRPISPDNITCGYIVL